MIYYQLYLLLVLIVLLFCLISTRYEIEDSYTNNKAFSFYNYNIEKNDIPVLLIVILIPIIGFYVMIRIFIDWIRK